MANLSFIIGTCTVTTACGLGIVALAGVFSSSTPPFQNLTNAEEITSKYLSLKCTSDLFNEIDWSTDEEEEEDSDDEDNFDSSSKVSSCLMVWWTKTTYDNNKHKGHWNLLWTVKDDEDGVVLTSTIQTKSDGKLKVDGVVYYLSKEDDKWKTKSKENKTETEITNGPNGNLIIKPGNNLDKKEENWGFDFTNNNICSQENECKKETKLDFKGFVWEWSSNGNNKEQISNWSSNFGDWNKSGGLFTKHSEDDYQSIEGKFTLTSKYGNF